VREMKLNIHREIEGVWPIRWFALWFFIRTCLAQDPCMVVNQAKARTYAFHPGTLTKVERAQKSKEMDEFWRLVKSSGPAGFACVRQLIAAETTDTYFLFDGASLLEEMDKSGASDKAIVGGLSRTDMKDVAPDGFIDLCLQLSRRNIDIGTAANKYLHSENVTAYLPRHGGYKLDRLAGAILLYGSLEPGLVDKYLIPELSSSNPEVRNTAALVLSQNLTEQSFKALSSLGSMENFSKEARESVSFIQTRQHVESSKAPKYNRQQMLDKLARLPQVDPDIDEAENKALDDSIYATFTAADLDAMREGRRKMITGVSNESVEGYEEMSRILLNLINAVNAYPQYRTR
jgi:hypothetical protein